METPRGTRGVYKKSHLPPPLQGGKTWLLVAGPDVHLQARERELAGDLVDKIHLTRVQTRLELVSRHFELEHRGLAVRGVERRPLDDGRFIDFDLSAVEREARPDLGMGVALRRLVHLVVEIQLLIAAHD